MQFHLIGSATMVHQPLNYAGEIAAIKCLVVPTKRIQQNLAHF